MTSITVHKQGDKYLGFVCNGHAGYAEFSKDIVCASISVLVINTINSIEKFTNAEADIEAHDCTGYISCSFKKPVGGDAALLINSMTLGLMQIQEQYGTKYIDVKIKEV